MIRFLIFIIFFAVIIYGIGNIIIRYNPKLIEFFLRKELKTVKRNKKVNKLLHKVIEEKNK